MAARSACRRRPSARRGACASRGRSTPSAATCGRAREPRTRARCRRSGGLRGGPAAGRRPPPRPCRACSTRQSPGAVSTRRCGRRRSMAACSCAGQAAAVARSSSRRVVQRPAGVAQRLREVAHGGQEHHRARLARPDVRRFLGHLGHPDRILRGVETVEGGGLQVELVAQHDHQVRSSAHARPGAARQASEQYFTSSQFFAQALAPAHRAAAGQRRAWPARRPCCRESWRRRVWSTTPSGPWQRSESTVE